MVIEHVAGAVAPCHCLLPSQCLCSLALHFSPCALFQRPPEPFTTPTHLHSLRLAASQTFVLPRRRPGFFREHIEPPALPLLRSHPHPSCFLLCSPSASSCSPCSPYQRRPASSTMSTASRSGTRSSSRAISVWRSVGWSCRATHRRRSMCCTARCRAGAP